MWAPIYCWVKILLNINMPVIMCDELQYSQVESCSANVYNGIQSSCLEQFEAVKSCLGDNTDEWAKCAVVRRELEVCSVRNSLGELKK